MSRVGKIKYRTIISMGLAVLTAGLMGCQAQPGSTTGDDGSGRQVAPEKTPPMRPSPTRSLPAITTPEPEIITLTLKTSIEGNAVPISGAVDLPDGAMLDVGLRRAIIFPEDPEDPGYFDVDYAQVEVRDSLYEYLLVDNRKANANDFVATYNEDEPPQSRLRIGENVQVHVSFSPQSEGQTARAVEAAGGSSGDALATSPQRNRIGEGTDSPYWTLNVTDEFVKAVR